MDGEQGVATQPLESANRSGGFGIPVADPLGARYTVSMPTTKLTPDELAIATRAVAMLATWDWSRGEPLAALTIASRDLFGEGRREAIVALGRYEAEFAPGGRCGNSAPDRLAALGAVVRLRG